MSSSSDPVARRPVPFVLLAVAAAGLVLLLAAIGPIRDIDYYWHLLVGRDILAGIPVGEAGRGWSFAPLPDDWVSTQWLAEALFAWLEGQFGLQSALGYRVISSAVVLVTLALVTVRGRPIRVGVWVFALASAQLAIFAQERSQQLTYILAPIVGLWLERTWRDGRLPRWWVVLPTVLVWAQFHGGWVMLPFCLGLAAVGRLLDHGWRDRTGRRAILLSLACVVTAAVSPAGWDTVTSVRRFASSTRAINEWQSASLWAAVSLPIVLMLILTIAVWAKGRQRPTASELLIVLSLFAFGFLAYRNEPTAALILAPLLTGTLARALGDSDPTPPGTPIRLRRTSIAICAVGFAVCVGLAVTHRPVVDPTVPRTLLATIHEVPGQRILNTYNISGPLLWFGGPPPHLTVGIDGRADRNGADYSTRYFDLIAAKPGWEYLFNELKPTAALLTSGEAISRVLVAQRDWVVVGREGDYLLLRSPDSTGWPTP